MDIPSTSDDENFSETDLSMSGLSPEDDHFHLKIETDSSDDMDYNQCDDVYTHVELVNEKSNPLPFPNLSS